jgi:hypothetical protein
MMACEQEPDLTNLMLYAVVTTPPADNSSSTPR